MSAPVWVCACGEPIPDGEHGTVWIKTPLGLTTARTHRDHGCARLAVEACAEQPAERVHAPVPREKLTA